MFQLYFVTLISLLVQAMAVTASSAPYYNVSRSRLASYGSLITVESSSTTPVTRSVAFTSRPSTAGHSDLSVSLFSKLSSYTRFVATGSTTFTLHSRIPTASSVVSSASRSLTVSTSTPISSISSPSDIVPSALGSFASISNPLFRSSITTSARVLASVVPFQKISAHRFSSKSTPTAARFERGSSRTSGRQLVVHTSLSAAPFMSATSSLVDSLTSVTRGTGSTSHGSRSVTVTLSSIKKSHPTAASSTSASGPAPRPSHATSVANVPGAPSEHKSGSAISLKAVGSPAHSTRTTVAIGSAISSSSSKINPNGSIAAGTQSSLPKAYSSKVKVQTSLSFLGHSKKHSSHYKSGSYSARSVRFRLPVSTLRTRQFTAYTSSPSFETLLPAVKTHRGVTSSHVPYLKQPNSTKVPGSTATASTARSDSNAWSATHVQESAFSRSNKASTPTASTKLTESSWSKVPAISPGHASDYSVVTAYTTYCATPTTFAYNNQTVSVSSAKTITITDCPCTLTKASGTGSWVLNSPTPVGESTAGQDTAVAPSLTGENSNHETTIISVTKSSTVTATATRSPGGLPSADVLSGVTTTQISRPFLTTTVSALTTVCSTPTTFAVNSITYSVLSSSTVTISNCVLTRDASSSSPWRVVTDAPLDSPSRTSPPSEATRVSTLRSNLLSTFVTSSFTTEFYVPTTVTYNSKVFSVTGPTTLTVTDCPCTLTRAIYSATRIAESSSVAPISRNTTPVLLSSQQWRPLVTFHASGEAIESTSKKILFNTASDTGHKGDTQSTPSDFHRTLPQTKSSLLASNDFRESTPSYGYITTVVPSFTTFCPTPTTVTFNSRAYTATAATILTITDCPCTFTRALSTPGGSFELRLDSTTSAGMGVSSAQVGWTRNGDVHSSASTSSATPTSFTVFTTFCATPTEFTVDSVIYTASRASLFTITRSLPFASSYDIGSIRHPKNSVPSAGVSEYSDSLVWSSVPTTSPSPVSIITTTCTGPTTLTLGSTEYTVSGANVLTLTQRAKEVTHDSASSVTLTSDRAQRTGSNAFPGSASSVAGSTAAATIISTQIISQTSSDAADAFSGTHGTGSATPSSTVEAIIHSSAATPGPPPAAAKTPSSSVVLFSLTETNEGLFSEGPSQVATSTLGDKALPETGTTQATTTISRVTRTKTLTRHSTSKISARNGGATSAASVGLNNSARRSASNRLALGAILLLCLIA